jgi:hypothetical protein
MVCGKTLLSLVSLRVLLEVNKGNAYSTTALSDNRPDNFLTLSNLSTETAPDLLQFSKVGRIHGFRFFQVKSAQLRELRLPFPMK